MFAIGRLCNLSRTTIKNLVDGNNPNVKTLEKILSMTRSMSPPVTREMFKQVRGKEKKKRVYRRDLPYRNHYRPVIRNLRLPQRQRLRSKPKVVVVRKRKNP
jgi:hypothetical protein